MKPGEGPAVLRYRLSLEERREHRFRIELRLPRALVPGEGVLELFLPVWTPGSYMVREFSRHVSEFDARDAAADGATLAWRKSAKNRWRIEVGPDVREVLIRYAVYAHELTVRTSDLTEAHALWNGATLFLWPAGEPHRDLACEIAVDLPQEWSWHCTLRPVDGDPERRLAHGLDELIDSPGLAGVHLEQVGFTALGRPHRFVFDDLAGMTLPTDLAAQGARLVEAAGAVFGATVAPYERYEFLTLLADSGGGGLEHAACSVLLEGRTAFASERGREQFLGLVAHEYFHVFNGKRMRPKELWRPDLERETHTRLLWVVEGFTAYYDDLLCRRAGALSRRRYLRIVADAIAELRRTPGRLVHPLAEASFDAWIKLYMPDESTRNTSQSYYAHGALAAMCLDLAIRTRSEGACTLDDVLRRLYRSTYEAGRGFDRGDIDAAVDDVVPGLSSRLTELVDEPFDPDFVAELAPLGLELVEEAAAEPVPWLGVRILSGSTNLGSVQRGSPAAAAGLAPGDELIGFAGLRLTPANLDDVLRGSGIPGRETDILVARRGRITPLRVTPRPAPATLSIRPAANADESARGLADAWLGSEGSADAAER